MDVIHGEYNIRTVDIFNKKKMEKRTIFHLDTRCEIKDDVVLAGYKWVTYTQGFVAPARDLSPEREVTYI